MGPENSYLFNDELSEKIKTVFLDDAKAKYAKINTILEDSLFSQEKKYIFKVAHGYKANAGYMGQNELLQLATSIDSGFKAGKSDSELLSMTGELLKLLGAIIRANSKE